MDEEACYAADDRTGEEAVFRALEQSGEAESGVSDEVISQHGLPAESYAALEHELNDAVDKAGCQGRSEAPADAEDNDRQHCQVKRAALRHFPNGQQAQHSCRGDKYRAFADGAEREVGFFHFAIPPKK